ncbi:MAG: hypothetical protein E4H20_02775 [Spirochaetales bacterium]|nr:MAG: hypothetical protein E4H20_02775 [Spirochaetales bacterium]
MKFKTIFILFNIVLIFSFAFIFLMPFFLLGGVYSLAFWSRNWPLAVFFLAVLGVFNIFFANNWKLFSLVEKEDWQALSAWLTDRVFNKHRVGRRYVRLLVNASLLRSDTALIERLETMLAERYPAVLRRDAVLFGAARLLKNDPVASEVFLAPLVDARGVENAPWLGFYHAFTLILLKKPLDAIPRLRETLGSKDPILSLLSAYLLGSLCAAASDDSQKDELVSIAEVQRKELAKRYSPERWSRETERAKAEVHVVILSKLIDDAGAWMFVASEKKASTG